ncbi:MAG: sigma-70 family RNA polymerase sigma factor [Candidatus Paceibacterota bacterium]
MENSDELKIKEYLLGNEEVFKELVYKYTPSIFNFSARFVGVDYANDIVQDVFIKVWKNIKKFDYNKASFKTWIFTIARNTVTDYLRKKKMINFSALDKEEESFADNIEDDVVLPDEALIKLEDKEFLNKLLDEIPTNYKEVLVLYYQEDMTFKEIGELLGKPLNTVKSHHHRALTILREMLK